MTDDQLIGYAVGNLTAVERAEAEGLLRCDANARVRLNRLRQLLAPLAADRDTFAPPPGLATRTVGRVAEVLVAEGRFDGRSGEFRDPPVIVPSTKVTRPSADSPVYGGWPRADVFVAAGVLLLLFLLGVPMIQKLRARADAVACREHLRQLHSALKGYADSHDGRLPMVGSANVPTAGGFVSELVREGHAMPGGPAGCGKLEGDPDPGYAYTLGHVGMGGQVTGVRLTDAADATPIAADLPRYGDDRVSGRHGGWNVLTASGSVRFTTSVNVGLAGDDIFRNDAGYHRAGLHAADTSLGRPFDRP